MQFFLEKLEEKFFINIKKEYEKYILNYVPTLEEQIKDITNSIKFGDAQFNAATYMQILNQVEVKEVQQKIMDWFNDI